MADATCSTPDCSSAAKARGMCDMHLQRDYRSRKQYPRTCEKCGSEFQARWHGTRFCSTDCRGRIARQVVRDVSDPVSAPRGRSKSLRRAFVEGDWPSVIDGVHGECLDIGDCWVWQGSTSQRGYGRIAIDHRRLLTHRLVALAMNDGHIAPGMQVHHKCANRACCKPEHLQVVAPEDNAAEMLERNRYQRRIAALEQALGDLDPDHPLLFAS